MPSIYDVYKQLKSTLDNDPKMLRNLKMTLNKLVLTVSTQAMTSDKSYCYKFMVPERDVLKLFKTVSIKQEDVFAAFHNDWGAAAMSNNMHSNSYYQILLLFIYYGIKQDFKDIHNNALVLLLLRMWNGRMGVYFPKFCDPDIMKYVVTYMYTNRNNFFKYDGPFELIKDYVAPSLLTTYKKLIIQDNNKLKRLFEQSYVRINQYFAQSFRKDIKTGKNKAQAGVLPLYMKAKKEGYSMKNPKIYKNEDSESDFTQNATVGVRDPIIRSVTSYIATNPLPSYPDSLIKLLNKKYKLKENTIKLILLGLHNSDHTDIISDILVIILSQTNVQNSSDICSKLFTDKVQKYVISSKNNKQSIERNKIINTLLDTILHEKLNKSINSYCDVNKIQLRKTIIQGLLFNLRKNICKTSGETYISFLRKLKN